MLFCYVFYHKIEAFGKKPALSRVMFPERCPAAACTGNGSKSNRMGLNSYLLGVRTVLPAWDPV